MEEHNQWKSLSKLIEHVPLILILLGVSLFGLGLAGGVTYSDWLPFPDFEARLGAEAAGVVVFAAGIYFWWTLTNRRTHGAIPKAQNFGIEIDYPKAGAEVDIVDVLGKIKKAPPEGYTLEVFKIFPRSQHCAPIGSARITIEKESWEAKRCNIGGKDKPGDPRDIGVFLVGPGGAVLLDYYTQAAQEHRKLVNLLRDSTGEEGSYLPLIKERTPDMVECDRVSVKRKMS